MKRTHPFVLVFVFAVAVPAFSQTAQTVRPGVARWPIKTSLDPTANQVAPTAIGFDELAQLPDPKGVKKNDRRYQSKRIPGTREGEMVSVEGWVQLVAGERDGDYHIQITKDSRGFADCLIVEVPNDGAAFTQDATLQPVFRGVREAVKGAYLRGREPSTSGSILKPVRMRFTGQLFYDDAHVGDAPRGKKGCKALSLWEIHPIVKAEPLPSA
jgi:hypothetical protein